METSNPQIGKFVVLKRLGAGGMAEVFKCRQNGLGGFDKIVVVKRILPSLVEDPGFVKMFLDEARIVANLNHPNIVQVYDIAEDEGFPYIAMEYVHGPTFGALLSKAREKKRMHPGHAAMVMAGVCAGLHYAHTAKDHDGAALSIVHRDVSPQNVVVGLNGTPKLLDFGVAKAKGRLSTTVAGTVKGKLRYMAPEQLHSQEVDARADVFSAGVCLYAATTGTLPFKGDNELQVMQSLIEGRYQKPSELVPDYPQDLEAIIEWAMATDPTKRCPSCHDLQLRLEQFVASGPYASSQEAVAAWIQELMPDFDADSSVGRISNSGTFTQSSLRKDVSGLRASPTGLQKALSSGGRTGLTKGPPQEVADVEIEEVPAKKKTGPLVIGGIAAAAAIAAAGFFILSRPTEVTASPTPKAEQELRDKRAAATTYVEEAERLRGEMKYKQALELVQHARDEGGANAELLVRIGRIEDELLTLQAIFKAKQAEKSGDLKAAHTLAHEALERAPANEEAQAIANRTESAMTAADKAASEKAAADKVAQEKAASEKAMAAAERAAADRAAEHRRKSSSSGGGGSKSSSREQAAVAAKPEKESAPVVETLPVPTPAPTPAPAPEPTPAPAPAPVAVAKPAVEAPAAPAAPAEPRKPRLPASYSARSIKDLARVMALIESEAAAGGGLPADKVRRTTEALLRELSDGFSPGSSIELFPRGMYWLIVNEARKGTPAPAIGSKLTSAHLRGELAKMDQ